MNNTFKWFGSFNTKDGMQNIILEENNRIDYAKIAMLRQHFQHPHGEKKEI